MKWQIVNCLDIFGGVGIFNENLVSIEGEKFCIKTGLLDPSIQNMKEITHF